MPVTINGTTGIVSPNYTGNGSVPVGSVYHFATSTPPTGFLICNGDAVPNGNGTVQGVTADFSALYAIVGTTYGAAGTLPDLRGKFIRCNGSDGTYSSAAFGTTQADALRTHTHTTSIGGVTSGNSGWTGVVVGGGILNGGAGTVNYTSGNPSTGTSTETRPANIALLACIKY